MEEIFVSENINMTHCGFIPFGFDIEDHCLIFIEVNTMSFIGEIIVIISRPQGRRLHIWIPREIDKYSILFQ